MNENDTTGLPWPKSWKGAYLLVLGFFTLWISLLVTLGESFK